MMRDDGYRPTIGFRIPAAILLTFIICGLALSAGCGKMAPPGVSKRQFGVHYDTAYETWARNPEKPLPALVRGAWDEFFDTLSEPVAIVDWRDDGSTWEVYHATNREPTGGAIETFSKQRASENSYGVARVDLPRRQRGMSPDAIEAGRVSASPSSSQRRLIARLPESEIIGREEFVSGLSRQITASRQKDLLLFVHGFNVGFDEAVVRTAQIALDLPFNGAIVCYSWPSQQGLNTYQKDEQLNQESVPAFAEFLTTLRDELPEGTRIHLVVHSMGNRLVLRGLQSTEKTYSGVWLENLVLCAPDVGIRDFQDWIPAAARQSERTTLYVSRGDVALVASENLHLESRIGSGTALDVVDGLETIDCSDIEFSFLGHSYYGSNLDVLGDLFELIKLDRPAHKRAHLRSVAKGTGERWSFEELPRQVLWTWNFDKSPSLTAETTSAAGTPVRR